MELPTCVLALAVFSVCFPAIGGNNVTLTPSPVATVTEGDNLKLQCNYSGSVTPDTVNWYLNNDTLGLVLLASDCSDVSAPPLYGTGRYNRICNTPSFSLIITNVTITLDDGDNWACDTTSIGNSPPNKASTTIKVNERTTSSPQSLSTNTTCKPDSAVFIILDICIIISYTIMIIMIIDLIICYKTLTISIFMACVKTGHRCLCILYIVLVIVVIICEIVIIIMIIIGHECQTIIVVGLVLGLIIITVTIIFMIVFIITGVIIHNRNTVQNPKPSTDVKITASLRPMFISDSEWIGPKGNPLSTDGKYIIAKYNSNTGETSLTITNVSQDDNGKYIFQVKIGCKIAKSSIHIMCDKEKKTKNSGPPAIHIGTQNKTEPKTTSKQTNERPQPLVGGKAEDKLKPRPQPPRPEDIDAKDRNLQGLSANYDDTQGLASGTPRPIRLTPLILNQETLQEEDVTEEKTKKKRKKKKKKGQMNEENQEEEAVELKSQRTSSED